MSLTVAPHPRHCFCPGGRGPGAGGPSSTGWWLIYDSLGARSPRSRCRPALRLLGALFLICGRTPCCVLSQQMAISLFLCGRTCWFRAKPHRALSTFRPHTVTQGGRASPCEFWGDTVQSVTELLAWALLVLCSCCPANCRLLQEGFRFPPAGFQSTL